MKKRYSSIFLSLLLAVAALSWGVDIGWARPLTVPGGIPDYFETPNWANSPALTKFVDTLPGLTVANQNNLKQYIPVAVADTATYPGSDYYEIELVQYREQMHSEFLPVVGDKMTATSGGTKLRGYRQINGPLGTAQQPYYLGPLIIAQKDRPVRVKFINSLPTGAGGNLFVPVDTTIMGSGPYEINYDPATGVTTPASKIGNFTQNRATLHLHGGRTPWVSDGTAHQWISPAGENPDYPRGVSAKNVPDMPDPGPGAQTFYWTNQQSARLMFFHDHAWGITRLNVYVGEAAGYLLQDPVELALIGGGTVDGRTYAAGTIPADQIPLVIQDKTFVNAATIAGVNGTDPTWNWGSTPGTPVTGDFWWPHVYMPAQNPFNPDMTGVNAMGRWHYGPWFFPSTPKCGSVPGAVWPFCINNAPTLNPYFGAANPNQPPEMPGTPNVSWGAEAFLDTMMVNGTVYPKLNLPAAQPYRFRILNASHDRFLNLQLYKATSIVSGVTVVNGGSGYTRAPGVTITPDPLDTTGKGATATATITGGVVTAITLDTVGSGYTAPPTVAIAAPTAVGSVQATAEAGIWTQLTEVGMVPAALNSAYPVTWPTDGREGGVPDPDNAGPAFIQIGTEGGFLPAPVLLENQPVTWNLDPTMFNVGNVLNQADGGGTLFLGPAERADVIVDFTNFAGQTLILYNDAPTAFPALDPHYDYYTGAPDRTDIGGYVAIPPGVGPNIRTVMQINVPGTGGLGPANDYSTATLTALEGAFAKDVASGVSGVFQSSQEPIVVGQTAYNTTYNTTFPATWPNWGVSRISDGAISFSKADGTIVSNLAMKPKAIHDEMGATFDDYGRMSAKLGLEMPFTNAAIANFILQNFVDPVTETVNPDEIQVWRITHNGVDTHPIHFHLFDVQLLNRVGWDGFIRLPDPNERGWKDTVRMSPLEDTIVALRPVAPRAPFGQPDSIRPLHPAMPFGSTEGFAQIDITNGGAKNPLQTNVLTNYKHEYTWHCHILSHEENDMMRPVSFVAANVIPSAPTGLAAARVASGVTLAWVDPTPVAAPTTLGNPANEIGFRIERAPTTANPVFAQIGTAIANATTYTDATAGAGNFSYRVIAFNAAGQAVSNTATVGATVDTVAITTVTYSGTARTLAVTATSSGAPSAALTATIPTGNLGTLSYNAASNTYRRTFSNVNTRPASVTVTSSAGGSATYNFPAADTLTINTVTYNAGARTLLVNATVTSANVPPATLSASAVVGGNTVNLGTLTRTGNNYSRTFSNVNSRPTSVTVTSSGGGSAIYTFPADTVAITVLTWTQNNRRLAITATSTGAPNVTLSATAVVTGVAGPVNLGTLSYNAASNTYRRTFTLPQGSTTPITVTVTSTGGGLANRILP